MRKFEKWKNDKKNPARIAFRVAPEMRPKVKHEDFKIGASYRTGNLKSNSFFFQTFSNHEIIRRIELLAMGIE